MNHLTKLSPLLLSSALMTLAAQPGLASMTSITGIRLNPTDTGLELVFDTQGGDASSIFTVSQGNNLRADITRAQLNLPEGESFQQANPAPGISQVTVIPLDANSVRVTISGTSQPPTSEVASSDNQVVMSIRNDGQATQTPTPVPEELVTVPAPADPPTVAQATPPAPAQPAPEVLVPNPEVTIDGAPVPRPQVQQAPPFLPRAVAPPVGDIAVAEGRVISHEIDLGSNERIPRLLLRDAPAREVLSLLARATNLNLVFTPAGARGRGTQAQGVDANDDGPTVSLDIEDESVQDVFNSVLRITGLEANRVGGLIYVSPALPDDARSLDSRTLRLNQTNAVEAAAFLASLGAESTQTVTREVTEATTIESPAEGVPAIQRITTTVQTEIESLTYDPEGDSFVARPLQGLQAVADTRLNSVTLVGESSLVALATEYLTRLDLRRRQVAVNVKIIDIDLSAINDFSTSFSYQAGGLGIGFGSDGLGVGVDFNNPNPIQQRFIFSIEAALTNNNAKILTDPTLIVQEGQLASVALVEQVLSTFDTTIDGDAGIIVQEPVFADAGLVLSVQVERIDDNGFVTLNVSPLVSSPQAQVQFQGTGGVTNFLTPIARREVSSGSIRVRDGQTLILTGIIQERDLVSATKVPILGDIPILGALFRSSRNVNERNEVIVLLTPQILDDSDQAVWGYSYTPSEEVQEILDNRPR